jgi:hypothetical protein
MGNLVNQVKAQYEQPIADKQVEVTNKQTLVTDLKNQLDTINQQIYDQEVEVATRKKRLDDYVGGRTEQQISYLLVTSPSWKIGYTALKSSYDSAVKTLNGLKTEKNTLQNQYDTEYLNLKNLQAQLDKLESDYKKAMDNAIAQEGTILQDIAENDPSVIASEAEKEIALAEADASKDKNRKIILVVIVLAVLAAGTYIVIKKF